MSEETIQTPPNPQAIGTSMAEKFKEYVAKHGPIAVAPDKPAAPAAPVAAPATAPPAAEPSPKPAVSTTAETTLVSKAAIADFPEPGAPPAAKPATEPAAPTEPVLPEKGHVTREHFKALEQSRNQFREAATKHESRVKELEAALAKVQAQPPPDYEATKAELEKHKKFVAEFEVAHDERFIDAFDKPIGDLAESIKGMSNDESGELIEAVLSTPPGKARDRHAREAMKVLEDVDQRIFWDRYERLNKLQKDRAGELAKAPERWRALQETNAKHAAEEAEKRTAAVNKWIDDSLTGASKYFTEFQDIEGNPEHNQRSASNRQLYRAMLSGQLPAEDMRKAAAWAIRGPVAHEQVVGLTALVSKLQEQLAELQSAGPGITGGQGGRATGNATPSAGGFDPMNIAAEASQKFRDFMAAGKRPGQ